MITNVWKKSSRSNGNGGNNCVQARWTKSTRSNPSGNCVMTKTDGREIQVRDSKLGDASPILSFSFEDWGSFIAEIKRGITCPVAGPFEVWLAATGFDIVEKDGAVLNFTNDEWNAFVGGVQDGEFDLPTA